MSPKRSSSTEAALLRARDSCYAWQRSPAGKDDKSLPSSERLTKTAKGMLAAFGPLGVSDYTRSTFLYLGIGAEAAFGPSRYESGW